VSDGVGYLDDVASTNSHMSVTALMNEIRVAEIRSWRSSKALRVAA
jgi:hypothetical protein